MFQVDVTLFNNLSNLRLSKRSFRQCKLHQIRLNMKYVCIKLLLQVCCLYVYCGNAQTLIYLFIFHQYLKKCFRCQTYQIKRYVCNKQCLQCRCHRCDGFMFISYWHCSKSQTCGIIRVSKWYFGQCQCYQICWFRTKVAINNVCITLLYFLLIVTLFNIIDMGLCKSITAMSLSMLVLSNWNQCLQLTMYV